jgi:Ceramidase
MSGSLVAWAALGAANVSFCESRVDGSVAEPANAWSSVAYVAVGFWILGRAWRGRRAPLLLAGVSGVLIGLGSFALHATATFLGQYLDEASMFLLSALALTLALRRWLGWEASRCLVHFVALATGSVALLALVRKSGIPVFGLQMAASICIEGMLWYRRQQGVRYGELRFALGAFAGGFAIWILDITRAACDAGSAHLVNGHAVWHVLTAASLLAYGRYQEQFFPSNSVRLPLPAPASAWPSKGAITGDRMGRRTCRSTTGEARVRRCSRPGQGRTSFAIPAQWADPRTLRA